MPVLPLTRTELRKRHPNLKIRNCADLDNAIMQLPQQCVSHYLLNGAHESKAPANIAAILEKLDAPAKAALIDYLDHLKLIVESV